MEALCVRMRMRLCLCPRFLSISLMLALSHPHSAFGARMAIAPPYVFLSLFFSLLISTFSFLFRLPFSVL